MRQLIRLSGDTMDRDNTTNLGLDPLQGPSLPQLPEGLESAFNRGHTLSIEGTNVVRVPFGVRAARRTRPERADHWDQVAATQNPDRGSERSWDHHLYRTRSASVVAKCLL